MMMNDVYIHRLIWSNALPTQSQTAIDVWKATVARDKAALCKALTNARKEDFLYEQRVTC
jgi:hypothetical protein